MATRRSARAAAGGERRAAAAVLLAFAVTFAAVEIVSYTRKSATWDEPMHLTAGYVALARGDYRVDPSHPPFLRMWAALPLLASAPLNAPTFELRDDTVVKWLGGTAYTYARAVLYQWNDADRLLYRARFMSVVWGVALGMLLFAWTREWLGLRTAAIVLAFYTFSPNLSAHASLVTTDAGVTCFMFGAVYFAWRTARGVTAANVGALAAFTALALVSKFSGLVLLPILAVLLAAAVLARSLTLRQASAIVAAVAATSLAAVWAVHAFRYAPGPGEWVFRLHESGAVAPGIATDTIAWIDRHRLVPNAYAQGLLYTMSSLRGQQGFLAGEYSSDGWWYYFPVAFLIKSRLAHLALLATGLVVYLRRRRHVGIVNAAFVLAPAGIYLAFAMATGFNIGLRHILPVYPFALMVGAGAIHAMLAARSGAARVALAGIVAGGAIEFWTVYPNELTFFNQLVGGPSNGFRYLADSNLGWGAHLKGLKAWMDGNGVRHVNLAYFGQADPAYYGISCTHLPGSSSVAEATARPMLPGYVAISGTVLTGTYLPPAWRLFYAPFRDMTPAAAIGNSIRVYWVERWPEPSPATAADADAHRLLADNLLVQLQWPELAAAYYRESLRARPGDGETMASLAAALAAAGRADDALKVLRQAADAAPGNARVHVLLARALFAGGDAAGGIAHAEQAVQLAPGDADAQNTLGRVRAIQGLLGEAGARFERALQIDPTHAEARENLARLQQQLAARASRAAARR